MEILFWNTLTKKKEPFTPLKAGEVGLYTCGPTVYDYAHIGNFRTYIFEDILRRWLEYRGYRVTQVMNITDIDDKTIARSREEGLSLDEFTRRYEDAFYADRDALRIRPAEFYPRATGHIPEMVALAEKLREKGLAYEKDGSLYYAIERFPGYGRLAGIDLSEFEGVSRVENDEYAKDDPRDFVLWKKSRPGEPVYDTPLGAGRPGWHLECSAMSMKYLGESFDIHTGGVDNIFPHHENEIAQSEAATGKPYARFFLHSAHLQVEGEKMAKSRGNFHTLRDLLEKGHDPLAVRYLLLSVHYRHPLNFTADSLRAATGALERLRGFQARLETAVNEAPERGRSASSGFAALAGEAQKEFEAALADDLNTSGALGAIHKLAGEINPDLSRGSVPEKDAAAVLDFLRRADAVLALLPGSGGTPGAEDQKMIAERNLARQAKDFARADALREELRRRGVILEDTPDGTRVITLPRSG